MKLLFPSYKTTFSCDLPMYEVTKKMQDCVLQNKKEMKIKKAKFNGIQGFVIETSTGSVLYKNSFLPIIKVDLKPIGNKTEISMLFEMKLSVKIMSVLLVSRLWLLFL